MIRIHVVASLLVVGFALSASAQTEWILDPGEPVLEPAPEGAWDHGPRLVEAVIKVDGVYHMFYRGQPEAGWGGYWEGRHAVGHATSPDGIEWTLDPANPVLSPGTDDDWFATRAEWDTTPEGEQAQADYVEKLYRVLFSHPSVEAITWWDFSDRQAWQGAPAGLLRKDQSPKPAYDRLLRLVKGAWWTREAAVTRADGTVTVRVFRGRHRVAAQGANGARATAEITAARGEPNRVILRMGKVQ